MKISLNHDEILKAIATYVTSNGVPTSDCNIEVEFTRKRKAGVGAEVTITAKGAEKEQEEVVPGPKAVNFD